MYTTSRYASSMTRKAAMKMAEDSGEPYIARGKKTVAQLVALARKDGQEFVRILEEKEDKPGKLAVIKIDALGRWKWHES